MSRTMYTICTILFSLLAGFVIGIFHARAAPPAAPVEEALACRLRAPTAARLGEPLVITFDVENLSSTPANLLRWFTPLESERGVWRSNVFRIESGDRRAPYIGLRARRSAPTAEDYIALRPGARAAVDVDITTGYDLATGTWTVRFVGTPDVFFGPPEGRRPRKLACNEIIIEVRP